jgi:hypothetical protein
MVLLLLNKPSQQIYMSLFHKDQKYECEVFLAFDLSVQILFYTLNLCDQ